MIEIGTNENDKIVVLTENDEVLDLINEINSNGLKSSLNLPAETEKDILITFRLNDKCYVIVMFALKEDAGLFAFYSKSEKTTMTLLSQFLQKLDFDYASIQFKPL